MKEKSLPQPQKLFSLLMLTISFLMLSFISVAQDVTIFTDKDDYWPGEWVIITGSGWFDDDSVLVTLTHIDPNIPDHSHDPWYIIPDANGDIYDDWYVLEQELGTAFQLTALGYNSGWFAETFFTDAYQTQLINLGPTEGICGEVIEVTAQLQYKQGSDSWQNAAGETLTFILGSNTTTAITDANGIATTSMTIPNPAPTELEVDYAGSGSGNEAYQKENESISIAVTTAVANAGPISGETNVCANATAIAYSVAPIDGALTYTWTVPSGATISDGQGTPSILVDFGETTGNIKVTPANGCETGNSRSKYVTINNLPNNTSGGFRGKLICAGETGQLTFNALDAYFSIPYIIEYTDGTTIWSQEITDPGEFTFDVEVNPTITTKYYLVSITNGKGCVRTEGLMDATAQITIHALPEAPIAADMEVCYDGQIHTGSALAATRETIVWYSEASNGTRVSAPSGTEPGTYSAYAAARNSPGGCESETRTLVTVTINELPAAPTANHVNTSYNGNEQSASASAPSGIEIDWYTTETGTETTTAPTGTDVGIYSAWAEARSTTTGCVSAERTEVILEIEKRPITITADAGQTKVYGEADPAAFTYTVGGDGLATGDSFDGALSRDLGETVGNYAITKGTLTIVKGATNKEGNYNITYTSANLTITQLPVTVTADAQSKTYGDLDPALTFVSNPVVGTPLANGDVIAFTGALSRDAGENVNTYAIRQNTLDNANYNIAYTSADLTIAQLAVTVTADAKSKTYGDVDPALTFVSVPAVGSPLPNGEVIAITGALSRDAGETVGTYAIRQNTLDNANYNIAYTSADLTIGQLPVTVTADAKSKTYGDLDPTLTFVSVPAVGTVLANGELISFAGVLDRNTGEDVDTYAIIQNTLDNANYSIAYTSADLTIGQLAVTVTADAMSKTYGELDPALTFVSVPAVGSPLPNGEVIAFTGTLSRDAGETVGNYAIRQNTLDNANYSIAYTSADLTIGQLAVTVTADAKSKTYGDVDPALTFVSVPAVGSPLPNGEVIAITGALSRDAGETVGNYAIKQNTLNNANYNIAYTSADLTIGQLAVTVTADAMSKTYGELDPALTFVSNPVVGTPLANGDVIAFTGALSRDAGETVNTYAIRQNTLDNANYNIAYTSADLTIAQLAVTVTANAKSKTYGDVDPALTFVSVPAVGSTLPNGEVIAFTGALSRDAGEDVGTYAIKQNTVDNANYDIAYTSADMTISQLAVTVTADAKSKTYGDLDPTLTFVSVPAVGTVLANGELISFAGVLDRNTGEDVDTYAIIQNTLDNANYNIAYTSADLTIGQLAVTVTADAKSKTYGDVDPALTFVSVPAVGSTLPNGEVIAFTGTLSRDAGETVGTYAIKQNTLDNANYNIVYTSADLTIGQLAVTVTANAQSKTYGELDPALTFVSVPAVGSTLPNGEVIAFTGALSRDAGETVGNYAIKQNTMDNANYNIVYTSADLTIGQLAVTVTADAKSKTYGELDPALTFVSVPAVGTVLANGEVIAFTGALSRDAGEDVGTYAIKQNTVDNANYDIAYTSADMTISQLAVTVTADAKSKTYGDLDPTLTFVSVPAIGTVLANGELISFAGVLDRNTGEDVDTYAIIQNTLDNANYNIAYTSADLTIGQLEVTVTADAMSKTYGELDPALTFVSNPAVGTVLANGEVIAFTGALSRDPGETVGNYAIRQNTLDNANYNIAYTSADLTIGQLEVTVTADAKSKTYGELDPALTFVSVPAVGSTLPNGEVIAFTGALSRDAGEDVGTYAIKQNTVDNANYDIAYTSADMTISQLAVTVTADAKSKTYGDLDPALTFVSVPAVGSTLPNGEVIAFTGKLSRDAGETVGNYA
ncbi:MBG domain-containing protein, partial [Sunxiuqinia sp. sy24]|uniref:MBG domain-containing protein n=1 Tax=Sunxiuqinia sp. sy24 TaxID=3461495 RepID=UPI004045CC45